MSLLPSDFLAAILGGLIFACLTARPGRIIGPRDARLGPRERQAYFAYGLLLGGISYGSISVFVRNFGWEWLLFIFIPLGFVQAALQAAYYLFLTNEDEQRGKP